MKASRFTDTQMAFIVKQGNEGKTVAEICHKAGISPATYFNWKNKYEELMPSESGLQPAINSLFYIPNGSTHDP